MDADPEIKRRQSHLLPLRPHASYRTEHLKRRETSIDRVAAAWKWNTRNRHIGIADRLELLETAARDDVVERREILIEKSDERHRLHPLRQQCETLEVGEKNTG